MAALARFKFHPHDQAHFDSCQKILRTDVRSLDQANCFQSMSTNFFGTTIQQNGARIVFQVLLFTILKLQYLESRIWMMDSNV